MYCNYFVFYKHLVKFLLYFIILYVIINAMDEYGSLLFSTCVLSLLFPLKQIYLLY